MEKGTIKVKEWFGDKIREEAKQYNMYLCGEYTNGMLDRETLRVDEVIKETEKAVQVVLEAETASGSYKQYKAWLPKSVILA